MMKKIIFWLIKKEKKTFAHSRETSPQADLV